MKELFFLKSFVGKELAMVTAEAHLYATIKMALVYLLVSQVTALRLVKSLEESVPIQTCSTILSGFKSILIIDIELFSSIIGQSDL
jgi:hypothetical protein